MIKECTYWIPGLFQPECQHPPWPPPPTNTPSQLWSGPACSESSGRTKKEPSAQGSQSSPAAETHRNNTMINWYYTYWPIVNNHLFVYCIYWFMASNSNRLSSLNIWLPAHILNKQIDKQIFDFFFFFFTFENANHVLVLGFPVCGLAALLCLLR